MYSSLEDKEEMDVAEIQQPKQQKPLPIIIWSRPNSPSEFEKIIIDVIGKDKFWLRWPTDRTTISCKLKEDRSKLIQHLKVAGSDYYSFTPKDERKTARIIYNLYTDLNEDDLLQEIKTKINADRVM